MTPPIEAEFVQTDGQPEAAKRLFLRAVLLAEHLVFLAAGSYSLWTEEEWKAFVLGRVGATLMLSCGVAISFLIAMVLAAATLQWMSKAWVATLAGGVLGPLIAAAAILAALHLL